MLKTKCECGAKYEYEEADAGQKITCECGQVLTLEPAAVPPPQPVVVAPLTHVARAVPKKQCERCRTELPSFHDGRLCSSCQKIVSEGPSPEAIPSSRSAAPQFAALHFLASVFKAVGIALGLIGVVGICWAVANQQWPACVYFVSVLVGCIIPLAVGQAIECLRLITMNSCVIREVAMKYENNLRKA